jgi:hypothetical protein
MGPCNHGGCNGALCRTRRFAEADSDLHRRSDRKDRARRDGWIQPGGNRRIHQVACAACCTVRDRERIFLRWLENVERAQASRPCPGIRGPMPPTLPGEAGRRRRRRRLNASTNLTLWQTSGFWIEHSSGTSRTISPALLLLRFAGRGARGSGGRS